MKKFIASIIGAAVLLIIFASTSAIGRSNTLLFLNWGEYIDETLIDAFEKKYNCNVGMDLGDSNEIFYSKVRAGTTTYDVVCPSDYMVLKMYEAGSLEKIDFTKLDSFVERYAESRGIDTTNESEYNKFKEGITSDDVANYTINNELRVGVQSIYKDMETNLKKLDSKYDSEKDNISNYFVPYLWGTWGIMYNTEKKGLEESVVNGKGEWDSLFDRSATPAGTRVAMYNSHQHAYYAACRYLGYDTTKELAYDELANLEKLIRKFNYDAWGTDNIKKDIVAGNIDVGFMWTGDFLYYYSENAATVAMDAYLAGDVELDGVSALIDKICSDERVYSAESGTDYSIGFDLFIPNDTIAFCDNLVINKNSPSKDLAYKFVDFMMSNAQEVEEDGEMTEIDPAFTNTYYVDYDSPYNTTYLNLASLEFDDTLDNEGDPYDSDLFWSMYDYAIGLSFTKYYPYDSVKGNILATFDRKYINIINKTFNNARA